MAFLQTYSARAVQSTYAGKNLDEGRPDDVFITIEQQSERVTFRKGFSGDTSSSLSSDHSLKVTLTYFPESQSAKWLTVLYNALSQGEKLLGIEDPKDAADAIVAKTSQLGFTGIKSAGATALMFPALLDIRDASGGTLLSAPQAVLANRTETSLGEDTGTVSFEFFVEEGFITSDDNIIGKALGVVGGALQIASQFRV